MSNHTHETSQIQPMPVQRDTQGWWSHPDIPDFDEDRKAWKEWIQRQGLETTYKALEDEAETHPVAHAYFEEGSSDVSGWSPAPPTGGGWFTFSIHDTEDGPVWVWARRLGTADARPVQTDPAADDSVGYDKP